MKDFDNWNTHKKSIESNNKIRYAHPREIWWCSLGLNIGAEIDGKNNKFERPVLIIKVYNKDTLLVFPITTKKKDDDYHVPILRSDGVIVYIKTTQARVVSTKRLIRKVLTISELDFEKIIKNYVNQFIP